MRKEQVGSEAFELEEQGDGPRLLYLHDEIKAGAGPLGSALARQRLVVAPVHPGFAGSERPTWVGSIRDVVEHAAPLHHHLGVGPDLPVVGASMGGWIAAELAARRLGDVGPLVLINPLGLHVPGQPAADFWFVRERDDVLFHDTSAMPQLEQDEQVANEETAARYGWSPRLHDPSLGPRLDRVGGPVLLVWGGEDRLLPPSHLEAWQRALPQAQVEHVEGVGHFPGYEAPDRVAEIIDSFLAAHSGDRGGLQ